ncbi:MAG TPA: HEPN domain-containing protein [Acidobacteriaceae bacterium]|nr:HEPN domain-containing protein [Acidobacteriaceae bacterium]
MTTHAIPDEASFDGEWWLPSVSDAKHKIAGTLAWSKNKATLALHDSFAPLRSGPLVQSSQTHPVIHGLTTNGSAVSVLEALSTGGTMAFGGAAFRRSESFVSSLVIVGAHVDSQTRFLRLRARIPGLPTWLGESGVQQIITSPTPEHSDTVIDYRIGRNPVQGVEVPNIHATLGWGVGWATSGSVLTTVTIASFGYLEITPDQPQALDWYFEQLGKATTLLAFLAGAPMKADEVSVKVAEAQPEISVLVGWNNPGYCPYSNPHQFFVPRWAMDVPLDAVFRKWFDQYASVAMPSQLALSVLSSDGPWIHVQFLLLMQALEGFHRAVADGTYMRPADYETVRHALTTAIPAAVESSHRDALKSRIKYGNELSLRKRLDDLAGRLDASLRTRIFGGNGAVPQKWIATRNYYTHWDEASRDDALDIPDMYYASVRLRHFLRVLYLDFVGIPQPAIVKALDGYNSESQHLIQLNHPAATFGYVNVRPADNAKSESEKSKDEGPLPQTWHVQCKGSE